jgi:hypothetical protein
VIGRFQVRPPTRSRASSTITDRPAWAIARAADRPASPPPTTITSAFFGNVELVAVLAGSLARSARATDGSAAAAAPAAAVPISVRLVKRVPLSPPRVSLSPLKIFGHYPKLRRTCAYSGVNELSGSTSLHGRSASGVGGLPESESVSF